MQRGGNPERAKNFVLASTGIPAVNISGTGTHSGLGVNAGSKMFPLNDR